MGQVYRARDTKLNRDVALKILPDSFADDPDRLARITREAQTLASLNHPNIAQIHGLEESGGGRALIMELVEGEDQMAASGADQESILLGSADPAFPEDWSRDGWLVYNRLSKTGWDIWAFNFAGRKSRPILEEPSNQVQARLSPDGRWQAYASNESGVWEVYVQPFPEGRGKWHVSAGGGSQPIWRGDGTELFYVAADDRLVAVPIRGIDTFAFGVSQPLFATRIPAVLAPFRTNYAVSGDGQRFLVKNVTPEAAAAPITIAVNWQEKWKR